jgi:transcriptional antiterminator NusG
VTDDLNPADQQPATEAPLEVQSGPPTPAVAQPSAEAQPTAQGPAGDAPAPARPAEQAASSARRNLSERRAPELEELSPLAALLRQAEANQRGVEPAAEPESADRAATEEPKIEEPGPTEPAAEPAPSEPAAEPLQVEEAKPPEPKSDKMDWYILKVQSNREESIREGLLRRVNVAGLGYFFGEVIVPTEKVTEFKGGKKKVTKRKLYPGYLVVHMEINNDTWFLVRETPGIGDFTGAAGHPSPMLPHEVARIIAKQEEKSEKAPRLKIAFREGERVKIKEGTFENFEGEVDSIDETNGRVTVMINIFGRSTPVELEYWQIETL